MRISRSGKNIHLSRWSRPHAERLAGCILLVLLGGIWILHGAIVVVIGVCQVIWSNTRQDLI